MAYSINDKVYSDHALMDEIIYHTKKIIKDIVIKNRKLADSYETKESVEESNIYMSILDNDIDIYTFPFTEVLLREYGYDKYKAREYASNRDAIPDDEKEPLLTWGCIKYLNEYEEKNFYYRMLNGLPKYGTDQYNVYLDPMNPKLEEDDCNTDFRWRDDEGNRVPIHEYPTDHINTLEVLGILDDMINEHKGDDNYNYLRYLTARNIPIYQARKADEWDILYMPKVEYLVRTRFAELYYINRQIYYRNFNQLAFTFNQDYFEELTIAIIVAQTLADMIVDIPEWYIRRDIFDLRSCKYFLDSMGVKYFKQIPLKYQIRIVKNINKLIRYKSTNKNMWDIINLFNANEDITVYKYYLLRDWQYRYKIEPEDEEPKELPWEMQDVYDFLEEDNYETILEPGTYVRDFGEEGVDNFDFKDGYYVYNFGYEAGYMDPETIIDTYNEPTAIKWDMPDEMDYGEEEVDTILEDREEDDNFGYMDKDNFIFSRGAYYYDFGMFTISYETDEFDFFDEEWSELIYSYPDGDVTMGPKDPDALSWRMPTLLDYGYENEDKVKPENEDNFGDNDADNFKFDKGAYYYDFTVDTEPYTVDPANVIILDCFDENKNGVFKPKTAPKYDFGDEDGDALSHIEGTLLRIEEEEAAKVIMDEYRNVYSLEFVKVPIGENYDHYIKDNKYRVDYDIITFADKYWDGEDTHSYVKNRHKQKDFTIEGTKYMQLEYNIDMRKYQSQIPYIMGMIFQSTVEIGDIRIELPMVGHGSFTLTDIFIFLQCVSAAFYNRVQMVNIPEYIRDYKPEYQNYPKVIDGGHAWTINTDVPEPEIEELEDVWMPPNLDFGYIDDEVLDELMPDELEFGDEEVDNIITPDPYDQWEWDFDYIDPYDPDGPPDIYDYGYYFNRPDDNYEYTFEDDEDYDFYFEEQDVPDTEDIRKIYDYSITYSMPDRDNIDKTDEKGNKTTVTEVLLKPSNPDQFIPDDLDFGEEEDEIWNLPQANHLYDVEVYDFGYHSGTTADVDEWDYGITYSYTEYTIVHEIDDVDEWFPWTDLDPEYYTLDIDGNPIISTGRTSYDVDGGQDEWSIVTHETFYDWLRWDNPWQFISESNRIYGFNLNADIGELAENIGVRHSRFGFNRGFTLEDLGIQDYIATNEITNVNDFLEVYETNIKCYYNLIEILEYPNTRDEYVTANYAFMYLFTKPLDKEFYRLKTGEIATDLTEILKQRSLALYKYYNKLIAEEDLESRQDFIRGALNEISNTLEYYIKGDNLQYAFEWIPTYSFSAITEYINLMINFFKSWKVYMLDPIVAYNVNDRINNRTIIADQISSIKEKKRIYDSDEERDAMVKMVEKSTYQELTGSCCQEVIDGFGHYVRDPFSPLEYDGGSPETEVEFEIPTDDLEWDDKDLNGGDISDKPTATYNVDGGTVGNRMYLNEMDGGGPMDLTIEPIDLDGGDMSNYHEPDLPKDNTNNTVDRIIDGGGPGANVFFTKSCIVSVRKQIISTDIRISNYAYNDIELREDGLYFYGDPEMYGYEFYGEDIPEEFVSIYDYGYEADYADGTFIPPDADFGCEEEDDIIGDPLSIDYDFTYHADMEGSKTDYDYNLEERVPDSTLAYNIDLGEEEDEVPELEDNFIPPDLDFGYDDYDYIHTDPDVDVAFDFNYNIDTPGAKKVFYDYNKVESEGDPDYEEPTNDSLDFGYMADDTERYEYFKRIFLADRVNYGNEVKDYYTTIKVLSDPDYVYNYTHKFMKDYLGYALEFIDDINYHKSESKMIKYIDDKADQLVETIIDINPLGWKDFSEEALVPEFGDEDHDTIVLTNGYYSFNFGYESAGDDDTEYPDTYPTDTDYWELEPVYDYGVEE